MPAPSDRIERSRERARLQIRASRKGYRLLSLRLPTGNLYRLFDEFNDLVCEAAAAEIDLCLDVLDPATPPRRKR